MAMYPPLELESIEDRANWHRKQAAKYAEEAKTASKHKEYCQLRRGYYSDYEDAVSFVEWHTSCAEGEELEVEAERLAAKAGLVLERGPHIALFERVTVGGRVKLKQITVGDQRQFFAAQVIEICKARINKPGKGSSRGPFSLLHHPLPVHRLNLPDCSFYENMQNSATQLWVTEVHS